MTFKSRFAAAGPMILLLCSLASLLPVEVEAKVKELSLYVHENRVGPNATLITVLTPSGNLSEVGFGSLQVFSNTVRDGPDSNNSTLLGVEPGFAATGSENIFFSLVFTFKNTYNGTISVQGQYGLLPQELAVIGGTGQFRFVSGYDVTTLVDASNLADIVILHSLYLRYVR